MEIEIPKYTEPQLQGAQQAIEERKKICEELKEIYRERALKKKEEVWSKIKGTKSKKV